MFPPRVISAFQNAPSELVNLCRPHSWAELTGSPAPGMRSIRDILVHLVDAEAGWFGHAVEGGPRDHLTPDRFPDLDGILAIWSPRRAASVRLVQSMTPEKQASRRPSPWDAGEFATVAEIVWHVVTHEQYHRGQIFTRLALLGRRNLPDLDVIRGS